MNVGSIDIGVSLDQAGFEKSINSMQTKMSNLGGKMQKVGGNMTKYITAPMAGAAGAFVVAAKKNGDYADSILDLESVTGMSTSAIQEWQAVADKAGTNTDAVTNASEQLTKGMSRGAEGSADMRTAFEKLGLSMDSIKAMTPDEKMETIMNALGGVEDASMRAELGNRLFRNGFKDLAPILDMSKEKIDATKQAAIESGQVMSGEGLQNANAFRESMVELKGAFVGAGRDIMAKFMPIIKDDLIPFILDKAVPAILEFADFIGGLIDKFNNLSPTTKKFIGKAVLLLAALGPIISVVGTLITVGSSLAGGFLLLTSPIGLAIAAIGLIIAAGVLLYKNWDTVKEKVGQLKDKIVTIFENIKNAIKEKIDNAIQKVKDKFNEALDFVKGLGSKFLEAGKNIINSIGDGIKAAGNKIKDKVSGVAKKIRDFFPFSPAKEGPLKDLNKLDFGGPIGDAIDSAIPKVQSKLGVMLDTGNRQLAGAGTGNITININNPSVRNDEDITKISRSLRDEILRVTRGQGR